VKKIVNKLNIRKTRKDYRYSRDSPFYCGEKKRGNPEERRMGNRLMFINKIVMIKNQVMLKTFKNKHHPHSKIRLRRKVR